MTNLTEETAMPETAYCPECRTHQSVVETFPESYYESYGEQSYTVTVLACEHHTQSTPVTTGPAPGAPFAPGATPSIRDCRTWAGMLAGTPAGEE